MKEIKENFEKFVEAMEKDDYSEIGEYMSESVKGYFSTIGYVDGIDEMKEKMRWRGKHYDEHIIRITNFADRGNNTQVQQSAYIQGMVCVEKDDFLHVFLYGGHFAVSYEFDKNMERWLMTEIRYDTDYLSGNTDFVAGWWKMIDYQYFMGQKLSSNVLGELDSPWKRFPETVQKMSDEECVEDTFYHYAFSMDTADFTELMNTYDEEVCAVMPHGTFRGKRDFTAYFKYVRLKEATFSHAVIIKSIKVKKDRAEAVLYRTEPHRIGTKVIHRGNKEHVFFSAVYHNEFRKRGGKWYLSSISYEPGVFSVEMPANIHYINDYKY